MTISQAIAKRFTKGTVKAGSFVGKVGFCIIKGVLSGAKEAYKDSRKTKGKKR